MRKLILVLVLGLEGCGEVIDDIGMRAAEQVCTSNGGLKAMYNPLFDYFTVTCKNGAKFAVSYSQIHSETKG